MFSTNILEPILKSINDKSENNAFCFNDKFFTYDDFAKCISKIRLELQVNCMVSKNIGLIANDDLETYASIFAIWFEGLAYVPLHPNQPLERNLEVIHQASIDLILSSNKNRLSENIRAITTSNLEFREANLIPKKVDDCELAYILFTSGSTGKPKGVPITRRNIGSFIKSFFQIGFSIDGYDRCLQCFDLTFDVSVQCFLVPLLKGACTYTVPHDQIKYSYVYGLLEEHELTFCVMAPSMLRFLKPYFDEFTLPAVKLCILTAEASPLQLIEEWSTCIPEADIYDFYGPTEATIYCTFYKFNRNSFNKSLKGMLSIGRPLPNLKAIILNEEGNIVGNNEKGELCISGDQLTPGYWNNSVKTKHSFIDLVFNQEALRFYKTGDLCFFDNDGDILYSGRLDYQVKIQGYRIELGEIEYHTRNYFKGQNAIAMTFENSSGNTEIVLFIEGNNSNQETFLPFLQSKVPHYMIPKKIRVLDEFPVNKNDKVDRNLLKTLM